MSTSAWSKPASWTSRQGRPPRAVRPEPPHPGTFATKDPAARRPRGPGGHHQLLGRGRRPAAARGPRRGLQSHGHQGHRPGQGQDRQGGRPRAGPTPALRLPARGLAARRGHAPAARTDRPPQRPGRPADDDAQPHPQRAGHAADRGAAAAVQRRGPGVAGHRGTRRARPPAGRQRPAAVGVPAEGDRRRWTPNWPAAATPAIR